MAPPRLLGGSGARRERGGGEEGQEREEDARGAVRNLVRDIKSELAMQREREHVPGGKGDKGTDDGDDARVQKMLEELVERHFRRGVYVGTFFFFAFFFFFARDNKQQQTLVFFKNTHALKNLLSLSLLFFFFLFFFRRNVRVGDDDIIFSHRRRVFDARSASSVARCDAKTTKLVQTRRKVFVGGGGDGVFTCVSLDVRGVVFFGYEKGSVGVGV